MAFEPLDRVYYLNDTVWSQVRKKIERPCFKLIDNNPRLQHIDRDLSPFYYHHIL